MKPLAIALMCSTLLIAPARAVENSPWTLDTTHCASPEYPPSALRNEQTGTTKLEFLIRPDGSIAATLVKTSSGSPVLDIAAQEALAKCHFKLRATVAPKEEMWEQVAYVWRLDGNPAQLPRRLDFSTCPRAVYPANARQRNLTGALTLGLLVRPDGTVRETRLVRSSGHPELDNAARTAMAACHFLDGPVKPTADEWATMDYVWSADDLPPPRTRQK